MQFIHTLTDKMNNFFFLLWTFIDPYTFPTYLSYIWYEF